MAGDHAESAALGARDQGRQRARLRLGVGVENPVAFDARVRLQPPQPQIDPAGIAEVFRRQPDPDGRAMGAADEVDEAAEWAGGAARRLENQPFLGEHGDQDGIGVGAAVFDKADVEGFAGIGRPQRAQAAPDVLGIAIGDNDDRCGHVRSSSMNQKRRRQRSRNSSAMAAIFRCRPEILEENASFAAWTKGEAARARR